VLAGLIAAQLNTNLNEAIAAAQPIVPVTPVVPAVEAVHVVQESPDQSPSEQPLLQQQQQQEKQDVPLLWRPQEPPAPRGPQPTNEWTQLQPVPAPKEVPPMSRGDGWSNNN